MKKSTKNTKSTTTKKSTNNTPKGLNFDPSKIQIPSNTTIDNKLLLQTIIDLNIEYQNFVGIDIVSQKLIDNNLIVATNQKNTIKYLRRKLQKIRKKSIEYTNQTNNSIVLKSTNKNNPFDKNLIIKWANLSNNQTIQYLIYFEQK